MVSSRSGLRAALALALLCAISALVLVSCSEEAVSSVPAGMELVWSDEFDVDGAPDKNKWDYSTGGNGWGNGEAQFYTDKRSNSEVKKGSLVITAKLENGLWTSARLKTLYKGQWQYGYIEVRAKLPKGVGTWPAIWMLPFNDKYGMWPRSGEIDIMEHVGFEQDVVHTTVHTKSFNHRLGNQPNKHELIPGVSKNYHTYALEWQPEYLQWYIDGKPFYRFENTGNGWEDWPFDHQFYLIINLAIGGAWGGQKGIDPKMTESTMFVDYVRVYQKK